MPHTSNTTPIGLIGCGKISPAYLKCSREFDQIEIVACADLNPEAAQALATEYSIPRVSSVEELLNDGDIEIILNLTIPAAHTEVNRLALDHGKHAYCEKPFGLERDVARAVLNLAREKNLRVGCAPDTVYGPGIQTCRNLIDAGAIGEPTAAVAFCCGGGHESWHPNPSFYYQKGGGPLFDMGPYYLTALAVLLGPANSVSVMTKTTFPQRVATCEEQRGLKIEVEVPTHLTGIIAYANGVLATTAFSFDTVGGTHLPRLEIYGTEASLSVPDPNRFDGPIFLKEKGVDEWREIPHTHHHSFGRGLGLADMASAIRSGRPHRASGDLAFHVLDIMLAFHESAELKQTVSLQSSCQRPAPLPTDLEPGKID